MTSLFRKFYRSPRYLAEWLIWNRKGAFFYFVESRYLIFNRIRKFRKKQPIWTQSLTAMEMYNLSVLVKSISKLEGNLAEVGVCNGGSANIIAQFKNKGSTLFLFDTFEGLPEVSRFDTLFHKGQSKGSLEKTKDHLSDCDNIEVHKGLFPQDTGKAIKNGYFSFVHLDVDIYKSTLDSLEFFYPRMAKGGIILTHDYPNALGVKMAFREYFETKREPIIEIAGKQAFIIKVGD